MTQSHKQKGNGLVIVVIILVLILLGIVGYILYRNFISGSMESPAAVQPVTKSTGTKLGTASVNFDGKTYQMDYLQKWQKVITKPNPDLLQQSEIKITNPAGTIQVRLNVSQGGFGGACDTNDGLKISYYKVYPKPVTRLAELPLYLVEAITDYSGGGYQVAVGLTPDGGATHAAVGDSHCVVQFVGITPSAVDTVTGAVTRPAFIATITFPKLSGDGSQKANDMQTIKDIFGSDDYKAAYDSIISVRKK